jgi:hypothetical protein
MRQVKFQPLVILAIGIVLLFSGSAFSQMSIDNQYNIDELMKTAQNSFDLDNQDAVFLLDKKRVDWLPDGRMIERIHRIIWIGTSYAVDHYGDHRIPYDSERCDFNVTTVRTWRDGTWWVTGETGIVETLPEELNTAYDYTNIREMMLLHNGIEIPCILEIVYEIEDKEAFRPNIEGHWNLKRMEPCVKSILTIGIPKGNDFKHGKHVDVPEYVISEDGNLDLYTWEMGPLDAIPYPRTEELTMLEPFVNWSTWYSWEEYGAYLDSLYKSHMILDNTLMAIADSIESAALTPQSRINAVIEYINNKTRLIDYPIDYWLYSPRKATRIFSTGYCHPLDRVILTVALLDSLGDQSSVIFICRNHIIGRGFIETPTLTGLYDIAVEDDGYYIDSYYNPKSGNLYADEDILYGRWHWSPGVDVEPALTPEQSLFFNMYVVSLELGYDKETDKFIGNGVIETLSPYLPYGDILGVNMAFKDYLADLISGIFDGAEITSYNPEILDQNYVSLRFEYSLPKPKAGDAGHLMLRFGDPPDGILGSLPGDVELHNAIRTSDIYLDGDINQIVKIKLDLDELEVLYHPENKMIRNNIGEFSIDSQQDDNYLVISRRVVVEKGPHLDAEDWPELRQLLLAETHDRNQTIYLKIKEEEE